MDGVHIKSIANQRYLFQFFHEANVRMVLDGGPWTFDNNALILARLNQGLIPTKIPLIHTNIWVCIYDLPAGFTSEKTGRILGNHISSFLQFDPKSIASSWMDYMRIKVALDVKIPLKKGKKIMLPDGSSSKVRYNYERLPNFCFVCGLLGHVEKFCPKVRICIADGTAVERAWGPELRVNLSRTKGNGDTRWLRDGDDSAVDFQKSEGMVDESTVGDEDLAGSNLESQNMETKITTGLNGIIGIDKGKELVALVNHINIKEGIYNPLFEKMMSFSPANQNKKIILGFNEDRKRRGASSEEEAQMTLIRSAQELSPSPNSGVIVNMEVDTNNSSKIVSGHQDISVGTSSDSSTFMLQQSPLTASPSSQDCRQP